MTPLYHQKQSAVRWFVHALVSLIIALPGSCTAGKCICTSER